MSRNLIPFTAPMLPRRRGDFAVTVTCPARDGTRSHQSAGGPRSVLGHAPAPGPNRRTPRPKRFSSGQLGRSENEWVTLARTIDQIAPHPELCQHLPHPQHVIAAFLVTQP